MDTLSYKTVSASKKDIHKEWVVIDAQGEVLGRLCSRIASVIRGKHKTNYTPNVVSGDHVIVINAEKIRLTGNKMTDKVYVRHTGHPGGQRFTTPKDFMNKDPRRIVEKAVKGMLPKGILGRDMYRNLHVYVGPNHPHEAQQPKEIKLS